MLAGCTNIYSCQHHLIDGLVKSDSPGSLRQPARTTMFPDNWATLPLSFGLMMCESTTSFVHVPT